VKVLMTADTVGGVWVYAMDLARALGEHGVRIALATMGAPLSLAQREEAQSIPLLDIFESAFKLEWMDEPWRDVEAAGDWLLQLADIFQPDIVHLNGYAHGALPWDVPVLMAGHSCVLSWWNAVRKEDAPASWNRYQSEIRQGIKEADLVVAPTQAMLDDLEKYYGPLPQSQVIYNGREAEYFSPKNKEPFILAAGRIWDEAKNI
jgi:hypothetical protein